MLYLTPCIFQKDFRCENQYIRCENQCLHVFTCACGVKKGVKNDVLHVFYNSVQTMEGVNNFIIHVFTLACKQVSVFANNQ